MPASIKRALLLVAVFATFILPGQPGGASSNGGQYLRILMYHRFAEPEHPTTNISEQRFREQLHYLQDNGYHVVSLQQACAAWQSEASLPDKAVFITVDDAYRSTYEVAFPILQEYGYPFTVFLSSRSIQQNYMDMLTIPQLMEMKEAGVTFGNHSHTHPHLAVPTSAMNEATYRTWVRDEIAKGKRFLAEYGLDSASIAFPYGEYNHIIIQEARSLGYQLLLSQDPGNVPYPLKKQSVLPRQAITGENMDLALFHQRCTSPPLLGENRTPPPGFLATLTPSRVAVQLVEPQRYRPGIINMFVSEWGALEVSFDAETGWLEAKPQTPLQRPINRVIVTAKEKHSDSFAYHSWLLCQPPAWQTAE